MNTIRIITLIICAIVGYVIGLIGVQLKLNTWIILLIAFIIGCIISYIGYNIERRK